MREPNEIQSLKMKIGFWKGKLKINPKIQKEANEQIKLFESQLKKAQTKKVFNK